MKGVWLAALAAALSAAPKKPVYVGSRVCGSCHEGPGMGHQYSLWLVSRHSQAWAALSRPEAKKIAEISGLRQEPQQSPVCMGCHATAAHAEQWERDDTFDITEGVQCEACHGPGSEYMDEKVMRDRAAAMKAGLRMPTARECMVCHIEKGSHVAVLHTPKVDVEKRLRQIAHPTPANAVMGGIPKPPAANRNSGPSYTGSAACGRCHKGAAMGYQYSIWRKSPHARAWAVLALPRSYEIARQRGIEGDPQKAPACLKCHSTGHGSGAGFLDSYPMDEGVGCEACHGAGSEYSPEAVMRDRPAARAAGLKPVTEATCRGCHQGKFDYAAALKKIAHPTRLPALSQEPRYKTPLNLALRPGTRELWVACSGSDSVIVADPGRRAVLAEIRVGGEPQDVAFTPDGRRAFVTNRHDDTLSVIDAAARKVIRTLQTGDEPHGVLTDRAGKLLYVSNTSSNDISVYEAEKLAWSKNLSASHGPWSLALSPDGATLLATNARSRFAHRAPMVSEVTAIETDRGIVDERIVVPGANLMMGIAWHPSGEFAVATLNRTKTLVPMTRLMQGWTITNGLAVLWRDGRVDEVLLDEPDMGFPDATNVAFTPDGRHALVTSAGSDRLAVIDVGRLKDLLARSSPYEREHVLPNHLGKAAEFVVKHIPTRQAPRGLAVAPDGRAAYVSNSLDDSIEIIDLGKFTPVGRIDLGGPKQITKRRFGERLFHNAGITFRKHFSCASCHPDGHVDGLTYDLEGDGIGVSPVDNRTLRGILDTAPFKWEGTNPSLARQCGARLAVFFTRLLPFNKEELAAVDHYVTTIPRPPNRYRPLGAPLTPAQRRGKLLFERTMTADGREIPVANRCISCHPPPYFTDRQVHDVGTRQKDDRQGKFDTPHLNNIYDSPPYLHDGIAPTLEEIWTVYNPDDRHGVTNDLTKDQLNDLIEYLKTL